jgi:hypothetical protein
VRDRALGVLLFLPVPFVLWLWSRAPLGVLPSLGLGAVIVVTHRLYARPFALARADRRCLWCGKACGNARGGPASEGLPLTVTDPLGVIRWRACGPEHLASLGRLLGFADRHARKLKVGILGTLALFLLASLAAASGRREALSTADALAFFRIGIALTVLPLGWLGERLGRPGPAGEPARVPFPIHLQALLGTRYVLWLFRLIGIVWLALGAQRLAIRLHEGEAPGAPRVGALGLVPREANVVVRLEIDRLRETPVGRHLLEARGGDAQLADDVAALVRESGWDPVRQLDALTLALTLPPPEEPAAVVIAEGVFDPERLRAALRAQAIRIASLLPPLVPAHHHGVQLFEDPWRGAFLECVFLGRAAVVVGAPGWGRKVIDVGLDREPAAMGDPAFARLLAERPRPAVAWIAARFDETQRAELAAGPLGAAVVDLTFGVDLADGIVARLHVTAASDDDAAALEARLAGVLDDVRSDAVTVALDAPDLVDRVEIRREGRLVDASLRIEPARVDALAARLLRATERRGPVSAWDPI